MEKQDIIKLLKEKYNIKCTLGCWQTNDHLYAIAYNAKQANRWCEKVNGKVIQEVGAYIVVWREV